MSDIYTGQADARHCPINSPIQLPQQTMERRNQMKLPKVIAQGHMAGELWRLNLNLGLPDPQIHFFSNTVHCFQIFLAQCSLSHGSFSISSIITHHSSQFSL